MAAVQGHAVVQRIFALLRLLVSRVGDPAVRLEEHGRAKVLLAVPPVRGAGGAAAGAENALVKAVKLGSVCLGLAVLTSLWMIVSVDTRVVGHMMIRTHIWWRRVALEVWLDGFVLFVEVSQVWHEILDDVGVREGVDAGLFARVGGNAACLRGLVGGSLVTDS